jgi:HD-GYP domain-containing protein (c-di-GMP phosphodiesterase class II)
MSSAGKKLPIHSTIEYYQVRHYLRRMHNIPKWFLNQLTLQQMKDLKFQREVVMSKSEYMADHEFQVAVLARKVAPHLGMNEKECRELELIALLHDIGKVGISKSDLTRKISRAEKLNGDESWERIKLHPYVGFLIFTAYPVLSRFAEIVLHHHQWWDGDELSYPDRIIITGEIIPFLSRTGEKIPYLSRVLTILDSYQAIRAHRPYADKKRSKAEALREIIDGAGIQYDPELAYQIVKILARDPEIL